MGPTKRPQPEPVVGVDLGVTTPRCEQTCVRKYSPSTSRTSSNA
jgi:hypothetical protein